VLWLSLASSSFSTIAHGQQENKNGLGEWPACSGLLTMNRCHVIILYIFTGYA